MVLKVNTVMDAAELGVMLRQVRRLVDAEVQGTLDMQDREVLRRLAGELQATLALLRHYGVG